MPDTAFARDDAEIRKPTDDVVDDSGTVSGPKLHVDEKFPVTERAHQQGGACDVTTIGRVEVDHAALAAPATSESAASAIRRSGSTPFTTATTGGPALRELIGRIYLANKETTDELLIG